MKPMVDVLILVVGNTKNEVLSVDGSGVDGQSRDDDLVKFVVNVVVIISYTYIIPKTGKL
jgi:hypothetical protein